MTITYVNFAKAIMDYKVILGGSEWKAITDVLNEMPTKSGFYPIVVKIVSQLNNPTSDEKQSNPEPV